MKNTNTKSIQRERRHRRIRAKVIGLATKPRLSFYKSNKQIYAQLIDDTTGTTLVGMSSKAVKGKNMTEQAKALGLAIAEAAHAKKVTEIAFDRGGFKFTGKVKVFADAAREGGLKF